MGSLPMWVESAIPIVAGTVSATLILALLRLTYRNYFSDLLLELTVNRAEKQKKRIQDYLAEMEDYRDSPKKFLQLLTTEQVRSRQFNFARVAISLTTFVTICLGFLWVESRDPTVLKEPVATSLLVSVFTVLYFDFLLVVSWGDTPRRKLIKDLANFEKYKTRAERQIARLQKRINRNQ